MDLADCLLYIYLLSNETLAEDVFSFMYSLFHGNFREMIRVGRAQLFYLAVLELLRRTRRFIGDIKPTRNRKHHLYSSDIFSAKCINFLQLKGLLSTFLKIFVLRSGSL